MEQRIISDVEAKLSTLYANMREPKEIKLLGAMQFFTKYLQRELEQRELDLSTLTKTQIDDLIEDCLSDEVRRRRLRAAVSDMSCARLGRRLARHLDGPVGGRRLLPRAARWRPPRFMRGSRRRRRGDGEVIT